MNGLCPACRRPYDDQSIEWKIISQEECVPLELDALKQKQCKTKTSQATRGHRITGKEEGSRPQKRNREEASRDQQQKTLGRSQSSSEKLGLRCWPQLEEQRRRIPTHASW